MRFDDNISLSYLNSGPEAVFGFCMGFILSWWCVLKERILWVPYSFWNTHGNRLNESFLSFIFSLIHTYCCKKEWTHIIVGRRKLKRGWAADLQYSSERTNVINGACWARLAWDWSSCNVCHRAINSLDRASQKLQKVRGTGSGP